MKKEFERLKSSECNFFFYKKAGVYGMYCKQRRHYSFCIPFIFGFRYSVSWGYDF